jgi:hypothetical protein
MLAEAVTALELLTTVGALEGLVVGVGRGAVLFEVLLGKENMEAVR